MSEMARGSGCGDPSACGAVQGACAANYLMERYGPAMTTEEAAEVLRFHPSHVRALCASGELPAKRIGDRWRIPTAKLAAIIEGAA